MPIRSPARVVRRSRRMRGRRASRGPPWKAAAMTVAQPTALLTGPRPHVGAQPVATDKAHTGSERRWRTLHRRLAVRLVVAIVLVTVPLLTVLAILLTTSA